MLQFFEQAKKHLENDAIIHDGVIYKYEQLIATSQKFAGILLNNTPDLNQARVSFMVPPGFDYVKTLWAIWIAGGVAVPLCISHPLPSLEYVLDDTQSSILVISNEFKEVLAPYLQKANISVIVIEDVNKERTTFPASLPDIEKQRNALILYTSGTTNKPKGVVTTHINIEAQINTLINAWEWSSNDRITCVLPLHHVHGIINVVGCSLWAGATCYFTTGFSPKLIFDLIEQGKLNVFMAVPTIYYKMIAYFETLTIEEQNLLRACMKKFRLMVCGSAALPVSVMDKWAQISGHLLLERYGMTELGMAISNPYHGDRKAGYVGIPLPGVEIKLADEHFVQVEDQMPGEILVKGANVFKEYWQRPEATQAAFTNDGWFKTGDVAVIENGYYRIMGRQSVDIIKSGGYKISALEIEEVLRTNEMIQDCAVVGIDDEEWGELIVAAIVLKPDFINDFKDKKVSDWIVNYIASYKKPRRYLVLNDLPRNAMGKVVKNDIKKMFV
jgi:malonyl-CoA/methylmalonyl-CoA synthetase